jgi:hypothetical protein
MRVRRGAFDYTVFVAVVAGGGSIVGACSDGQNPRSSLPRDSNAGGSSGTGGTVAAAGGSTSSGSPGLTAGAPGMAGAAGMVGLTSGAAGAASMAGAAGTIKNDPACPSSLADAFVATTHLEAECSQEGLACDLPITCASGTVVLTLTCQGGVWKQKAVGCDKPYDFCPGLTGSNGGRGPSVYCNGGIRVIENGLLGKADGPGPCPAKPPAKDSHCIIGGTGGTDREHCGYPCGGESANWTVLSCVAPGVWTSDGACK